MFSIILITTASFSPLVSADQDYHHSTEKKIKTINTAALKHVLKIQTELSFPAALWIWGDRLSTGVKTCPRTRAHPGGGQEPNSSEEHCAYSGVHNLSSPLRPHCISCSLGTMDRVASKFPSVNSSSQVCHLSSPGPDSEALPGAARQEGVLLLVLWLPLTQLI